MKKVQKQLLFLPVLCLSMAIGGCGKKETDKTDAADMTKTVPNYTLIYRVSRAAKQRVQIRTQKKIQKKI